MSHPPPSTPGPAGDHEHSVRVWDPFVRLFHWSLVGCVLLNLCVLEKGEGPHRWVGYVAAGLVLARIVWGFIGPRHARFSDFFPTPRRLAAHLRALREGRHVRYLGHNPLGALMMLALMALVLALGLTGWLQGIDTYWGQAWLEELHEALVNALMLATGLHATAALVMGQFEDVSLVRAMFTGVKRFRR